VTVARYLDSPAARAGPYLVVPWWGGSSERRPVPDSYSVNLTIADPAHPADSFGAGSARSCEFASSLVSQESHDFRDAGGFATPCESVRFLRVLESSLRGDF